METLRTTFRQFGDLYRSMAPSQRLMLVAVPLLVAGALGFLVFGRGSATLVPVSYGKVFTTEELMTAEQTLRDAGLTEYRREGQQLLAPRNEVERYNGVLLEGGGLPDDWAEEVEKKIDKANVFTSREQLQTMKDVALAKALRRMLRAMPSIADGNVVWARSKERRGWRSESSKVTATVMVRPRRGKELTPEIVESLRAAVTRMVPGLTTEEVTVFDQQAEVAYTPEDASDPFNSKVIRRRKQFNDLYRQRIEQHLSYIPDVLVTVNVELDNLKRSVSDKHLVDPKKTADLVSNESRRETNSATRPPAAEPGQRSNAPRSLQADSGGGRTETTTESTSSSVRTATVERQHTELNTGLPTSVHVSVSIPEDYYEAVAVKQGTEKGTSEEEQRAFEQKVTEVKERVDAEVQQTVAKAIGNPTTEDTIHVGTFVRIDRETPTVETSYLDVAGEWFRTWGSAVGLSLFAAWLLWMLSRSMPEAPEEDEEPDVAAALSELPSDDEEGGVPEPQTAAEKTLRDELQSVVRDDPETTAAVLAKWIRKGR